jgi:hypothetical protein
MAAITSLASPSKATTLRNAAAQANTGQTDWLLVPDWATAADIWLNITAVAGTSPEMTPSILAADPVALNDSSVITIGTFTGTPLTAAAQHRITVGPGTNALALNATSDSIAHVACILPAVLGVTLLLDRTSGNETYTYTLNIRWI